ncbi:MAG: C40 family peptidase [Bacteroidetes bacterium]|nr:C40 family peptidase [Bacteroidota bacterium]
MKNILLLTIVVIFFSACSSSRKSSATVSGVKENTAIKSTVKLKEKIPAVTINTGNVSANEVVDFAETLIGVPYKYGSTVKEKGFDCSGFINYVFGHYKISVPRTSKNFTNAGKQVSTLEARRGDLILFTGSNANSGVVGHMGIITENRKGILKFIHSSSGKNIGVIISGMNSYYLPRFVKVIRVFKVL